MAERAFPFDEGAGATVGETEWRRMAGTWQRSGVISDGPWENDLAVFTEGVPGEVKVMPGAAVLHGTFYENSSTLTVPITANESGALSRRDRIVLTVDYAPNTVMVVHKAGAPATNPEPPALDPDYEIPLAVIQLPPSSDVVAENRLWDERTFVGRSLSVGGISPVRGDISYHPGDDAFYMTCRDGVSKQIQSQVDLSPYAKRSDLNDYAPVGHLHDERYSRTGHTHTYGDSASTTVASGVGGTIRLYRRYKTVALDFAGTTSTTVTTGDTVATLPSGWRPVYRHTWGYHWGGYWVTFIIQTSGTFRVGRVRSAYPGSNDQTFPANASFETGTTFLIP